MKERILHNLPTECPWRDTLYWYDTIGSTNDRAKELARQGAPHGTVVISGSQSAGRGRMGRSFHSPTGLGVYLSVILRPERPAGEMMHLTCCVAVAMCDAVEAVCGVRPGVKWINDLILKEKKLGGILTELSLDARTGNADFAVIGIGINCRHMPEHFPPELRQTATSLAMAGLDVSPEALAAAMVTALYRMDTALTDGHNSVMRQYRADCITLGKQVLVLRGGTSRPATAQDVDGHGALTVRYDDGTTEDLTSAEVSVRGIDGYI